MGLEKGKAALQSGGVLMGRKLLFISKYPDIIQEFLVAMDGKEVEIDIASNGIEAASQLKKNTYQIVVTGLSLDGYNGEQIITYLNKNCPNTVCIIYTTTISPAQLHFFINERSVFRVFLRPVDFNKEFYAALEEAFEYYDVRVANEQDEASRGIETEQKEKETVKIRQRIAGQNQMRRMAGSYMKRLTALSLQEYANQLTTEQKEEVKALEWKAAELCFGTGELQPENMVQAEMLVEQVKEKIAENQ